jgi:squalene synthase HpnC
MSDDPQREAKNEEKKSQDEKRLADAYIECTRLTKAHYENFPVGLLVPKTMQKHVHAIYAFARHADDLADEGYDPAELAGKPPLTEKERLIALEQWEAFLISKPGSAGLPLTFIALHDTIAKLNLPLSLFTDLLSAFKQDVVKRRYENFKEVQDYCRRSANPVGRLVLLLFGIRDEELHQLSDYICTGLQLANFWQDVGVDLKKDRIYLPKNEQAQFGVGEKMLVPGKVASVEYRDLLKFQVDRTQHIFDQGEPLTRKLRGKLRIEIRFTWLGGTRILQMIRNQNYDTLVRRPKLSKVDYACLFLSALFL